jgi:predicted nucleotidyltransferase
MLLDTLRHRKQEIAALGREFGARRIRVFGSVARGEDGPDSDIDFLVDFPQGYDLITQRLPLTEKLAALCRRPVEVIPEHELSRHIRPQVLAEAVDL